MIFSDQYNSTVSKANGVEKNDTDTSYRRIIYLYDSFTRSHDFITLHYRIAVVLLFFNERVFSRHLQVYNDRKAYTRSTVSR